MKLTRFRIWLIVVLLGLIGVGTLSSMYAQPPVAPRLMEKVCDTVIAHLKEPDGELIIGIPKKELRDSGNQEIRDRDFVIIVITKEAAGRGNGHGSTRVEDASTSKDVAVAWSEVNLRVDSLFSRREERYNVLLVKVNPDDKGEKLRVKSRGRKGNPPIEYDLAIEVWSNEVLARFRESGSGNGG